MSTPRTAIFLINLVQDVNVLRPLIFMGRRDFGFDTLLLVSSKFVGRDLFGIWQNELQLLAAQTGARVAYFDSDWEALERLVGQGLIFAASESHLHNHVTTHSVFRYAPPTFLRVTLQHGFECVGFKHSADHVRAHGPTASFGADLVCAWQPAEFLSSMASSQRGKLLVTGPSAALQQFQGPVERGPESPGLVCENLHSVRLNGTGNLKAEFVDAFSAFCERLEADGRKVVLRPHPGGQYVLKNKVELPLNARIENAPIYRLDLRQFSYGISAPSSVLIDMLLADIPTAVWRDAHGDMDAGHYSGLTTISSPDEWLEFSRSAASDPNHFVQIQRRFLRDQQMPLDPADVYSRYAELFQAARRIEVRTAGFAIERERILFVANSNVPTLQLSFEKPLAPLVGRGEVATQLLTEAQIRRCGDISDSHGQGFARLKDVLVQFDPSTIIFCRYSGPGYERIIEWAQQNKVPTIYHIDDDLLAIPPEIGRRKFEHHNAETRIESVRYLVTSVDLVYASTNKLRQRLLDYFPELSPVAGKIYCSGSVLRQPSRPASRKFGYMASADHAHNLEMVLPAVEQLLERNADVQFELFGSIPVPERLNRFGDRVSTVPPVASYATFLNEFAQREWDVGICPLVPIEFNLMKANTKWVEYTGSGAAVVASRGTVYDECCSDGCGFLADTIEEWFDALNRLATDDALRISTVDRAQEKLRSEYSIAGLREQVLDIIRLAGERVRSQHIEEKQENPVCQTACSSATT